MSNEIITPVPSAPEGMIPVIGEFVVKTPDTCSGKPWIVGTRIKVKHVWTWVGQMGMTPAEVVAAYPQLSMAAVHAALAYYWSHQEEIHRDIAEEERLVAELKATAGPSKLQQQQVTRLTDRDRDVFVALLDDAEAKPNEALAAAAKRYKKRLDQ